MQLIDPPKELIAAEFRSVMDSGESRPLLVVGYSSDLETPHELVIKLREPGVFERIMGARRWLAS